ncbi:Uncharacterised protein [Mycobacterium tuberculosis]|uniref:Uncharacterized protein n=1 Tax=Mycobacterium tuberculosis TaxID=1773 RepID=A0A0U0UWD3_MYCTX|nr:Uncharacterised protein [Mycobacterium tuberculosis]COW77235.1 Uncharacterised protein [Mycobacterium tuberculosis]CPB46615.1 Uncharacterised protein [Mycobacterium tuberculosis]
MCLRSQRCRLLGRGRCSFGVDLVRGWRLAREVARLFPLDIGFGGLLDSGG